MNSKTKGISESVRAGGIDAFVFDFDGTLYESSAGIEQQLRPLMVRHAARVLDVPAEEAKQTLAGYRSEYKSSILGLREHHGVDPETFLRNMYDDLDLSKMVARPGLRFELERLQEKVPLIVFTNSNRSFTYRAIGLLDLTGVFDTVFTVEDNGFIRKPEIEAYEGLYRSLDLAPERVAMFDDIASSLRVMSGFGSRTILVGNGLRSEPSFVDLHTGEEHEQAPDFVDAATHDLVGFLRGMNEELEV